MSSRPVVDRRRLTAPEATVQPILLPELRPTGPFLDAEMTREDGRYPEQMRPALIKKGIISKANGSAYVELGETKLTCAVYGPRSSTGRITGSKAYSPEGSLNCEIEFLPFSSTIRRPYQRDAEEAELSAILESSLAPAVRRDLFPNAHVDLFISVLQDDGSVLAASILAATTALAQAQIDMYDTVTACSALIHESMVIVDPTKTEVSCIRNGGKEASLSLVTCAMMPNLNRITQVHSVGPLSTSLLQETLNMVMDGSKAVYQSAILPALTSDA